MRKVFVFLPVAIIIPLIAVATLFSTRLCACIQGDEGFRAQVGADPMKDPRKILDMQSQKFRNWF